MRDIFTSLIIAMTLIMTATRRTEAIQGVYTVWAPWGPCDVTCDTGVRVRYRACFPIGANCIGSASETTACAMITCPRVGRWSAWTNWTDCTKSCGIGMQTKFRTCLTDKEQCIGSNRHTRICNANPCKTSGGWSAWNEWSTCSEPCGRGVRYQDRTCEDPAPAGGGLSCRGIGTKIGFCFKKPCTDKAATQVSVFDGEAYLEYEKTFVAKKLLSLFVKFKPEETDGVILYRHHGSNDTTAKRNDTVMLRLEGGKVEFHVQTAGVTIWLGNEEVLGMGRWHNVFAAVVGGRILLRVNNGIPLEQRLGNVEMEKVDLDQQMFVGGLSEVFTADTGIFHPGFVGWIAQVRVSYEDYFLDETEDVASVSEETNHPIYGHMVEKWDVDAEELYPTFSGDDYTVFTCSDCHGKPEVLIEVVIKPFSTSSGLVWSNIGEEAGSYLMLYFRRNLLVFCFNLGSEKLCTATEPIPEKQWLTISVSIKSKQAKLRLNHEHAYILTSDGEPYRAKPALHFAGGELDYWTIVYLVTRQVRGFSGILYSMSIDKRDYDVLKEVAMRETGRMISASSSSVAAKFDEFHEPPMSEIEFQCDLSAHEDKLGVTGGMAFWLREGEIIQNFSSISIQKVPGMRHATRLTITNREIGGHDGFYGCLLRTGHYEILVHVFGVSFDDANDIDLVEVSETAALIGALLGSLCVLFALFALLKSGFMRRFPAYNAIMQRMPSWFTDGHRKNFLLRHTCSLQRTGQLPPDYIQRLLTMQEKAIQTPSAMDLGRLYGQPRHGFDFGLGQTQTIDAESDYDRPILRRKSDGTVFPRPLIRHNPPVKMKIPNHVKKSPEKYLPHRFRTSASSDLDTQHSKSEGTSSSTSKTIRSSYGTSDPETAATTITTKSAGATSPVGTSSSDTTSVPERHTHRKPVNRRINRPPAPRGNPKRKVKFRHKVVPEETTNNEDRPTKTNRPKPQPVEASDRSKLETARKPAVGRKPERDKVNTNADIALSDSDNNVRSAQHEPRPRKPDRPATAGSRQPPPSHFQPPPSHFQHHSYPGHPHPLRQYGSAPPTARGRSLPGSPVYQPFQPTYPDFNGQGPEMFVGGGPRYFAPPPEPQWVETHDPYGQWDDGQLQPGEEEQLYYPPPQEFAYAPGQHYYQ